MHPELTVFENIYYNAMTRLPAKMPVETKKKHVQNVIQAPPPPPTPPTLILPLNRPLIRPLIRPRRPHRPGTSRHQYPVVTPHSIGGGSGPR